VVDANSSHVRNVDSSNNNLGALWEVPDLEPHVETRSDAQGHHNLGVFSLLQGQVVGKHLRNLLSVQLFVDR
jgi:hypothetical protein